MSDSRACNPADDARAVEGYYAAGLHTLADAAFGDALAHESVQVTASHVAAGDDPLRSRVGKMPDAVEQLVVRRSLGTHLDYDSVWSRRTGRGIPLRYRLHTQSSDAVGHVTIEFHAGGVVDPKPRPTGPREVRNHHPERREQEARACEPRAPRSALERRRGRGGPWYAAPALTSEAGGYRRRPGRPRRSCTGS